MVTIGGSILEIRQSPSTLPSEDPRTLGRGGGGMSRLSHLALERIYLFIYLCFLVRRLTANVHTAAFDRGERARARIELRKWPGIRRVMESDPIPRETKKSVLSGVALPMFKARRFWD